MLIRRAIEEDLPFIVEEAQTYAKEVWPDKPITTEYALNFFKDIRENHVLLVAEDEGVLKGYVAGYYAPHPYNPGISILQLLMWRVPKEHRGSKAGWILMKAFLQIKKTDYTYVAVLPSTMVNHAKHFGKLGFTPLDISYSRRND